MLIQRTHPGRKTDMTTSNLKSNLIQSGDDLAKGKKYGEHSRSLLRPPKLQSAYQYTSFHGGPQSNLYH